VVLLAPKVTLCDSWAGRWGCLVFLVMTVTPPFSAGRTPTAYISHISDPSKEPFSTPIRIICIPSR
jgi:hypothetical protein